MLSNNSPHYALQKTEPLRKKIPEPDADLVRASVDKTVAPRFHGYGSSALYGGINWPVASSAVDWYTWDHPIFDHFMNTLLPVEKYRQTHPEYYMLTQEGKQQHVKNQFLMSPCLSNEEAKTIIERRFLTLANAQGVFILPISSGNVLRFSKICPFCP